MTLRLFRFAPAFLVISLLGGCEAPDGPVGEDRLEPFPGAATSLTGLGRTVLMALARGDTATLGRLRLTEEEHNRAVWPELPAARPEANFPVNLAWRNIELRNHRALSRIHPWYDGRGVELEGVQCRGPVERFETFRVHTDCWVLFESPGEGVLEAQLFKDVLERGGGFKIFRYYEERPRRLDAAGGSGG